MVPLLVQLGEIMRVKFTKDLLIDLAVKLRSPDFEFRPEAYVAKKIRHHVDFGEFIVCESGRVFYVYDDVMNQVGVVENFNKDDVEDIRQIMWSEDHHTGIQKEVGKYIQSVLAEDDA